MTSRVSTHEAKTHLSRLIASVLRGEEVVIYRGEQPVAKLVPVDASAAEVTRPRIGTVTTEGVRWTEDAFTPLDDEALRDWGL